MLVQILEDNFKETIKKCKICQKLVLREKSRFPLICFLSYFEKCEKSPKNINKKHIIQFSTRGNPQI